MRLEGTPSESHWSSGGIRVSELQIERMVQSAFPGARVVSRQALPDGFRNINLKLQLQQPAAAVVLRVYAHDPALCRKELQLLNLVQDRVPVPEVLHAKPDGLREEGLPPFAVFRYIEGVTFRELRRSGNLEAIAQAACSIGKTLAAIGRFSFSKGGWLSFGPAGVPIPTTPLLEGADPAPRFVDRCLAATALQQRVPAEVRERVHELLWRFSLRFTELDDATQLAHCDFNKRNILVRTSPSGDWKVAAVLDWEFAISGSPLIDVANFLRYERQARPLAEPHFSRGFVEAGGVLPDDWRRLARVLDLTALCESLTRSALPADVESELVELVRATVEDRDPRFE